MAVVIETTIGDLTVDLYIKERPKACLNFLKLCKIKYYNFNLFHNIERNFIAQTGDPTGVGDAGDSIWGTVEGTNKRFFEAENRPKIKHSFPGLLSFVSIGKNMISSQFFFTLGEDLTSLDGVHCVIGEVVEGHDVLRKLNEAIVDDKFRPFQDIRITHTVILDDPFEDLKGLKLPSRSPSPTGERLKNGRIAADENIDDTQGKSYEQIQEMLAEREAKARATILEIVGDLPDAEVAPPENVLFVCKLNPVTNDDDLEIIFSRFGIIKGCEVIRDKISGDSLQYAFVEFEDKKSCEAAYFKMDNVLIDDRRIHVDFSQSVAKVQWRGKGRGMLYKDNDGDRNLKLDFNNYKKQSNVQGRRYDNSGQGRNRRSRSRSRGDRNPKTTKNNSRDNYKEKYARDKRSRSRERYRNYGDDENTRNSNRRENIEKNFNYQKYGNTSCVNSSTSDGRQSKKKNDKNDRQGHKEKLVDKKKSKKYYSNSDSSISDDVKRQSRNKKRKISSSFEEKTKSKNKQRSRSTSSSSTDERRKKRKKSKHRNSPSSEERCRKEKNKKKKKKRRYSSSSYSS